MAFIVEVADKRSIVLGNDLSALTGGTLRAVDYGSRGFV